MASLLVADIGGTGSRLAVLEDGQLVGAPVVYRNHDYSSFQAILSDFLQQLTTPPASAAFAVAGPVVANAVRMTNLSWHLDGGEFAQQYGFEHVEVMNDFAALAWATLALTDADLHQVGGGTAIDTGNRGILGPGTGLGVSGLIAGEAGWNVLAGEGGHVTLAAVTAIEAQLIAHVANELGHCSAERLISGPGLVTIYECSGGQRCAPEMITRLAHEGDSLALQTVRIFAELLGTVAADLALTLGARGGIYLAGGILPTIAGLFSVSGFRERFEAKGRFHAYLAGIPTWIVTASQPSFRGLHAYMQRTDRV